MGIGGRGGKKPQISQVEGFSLCLLTELDKQFPNW